jgi:REP element-mobilizing transposase RayT
LGSCYTRRYLDPFDLNLAVDYLQRLLKKCNWYHHAYSLIDNHYHLLIEAPEYLLLDCILSMFGTDRLLAQKSYRQAELFSDATDLTKDLRNQKIARAHLEYGYTLKEIADVVGIHYTTAN